MLRTYESLTSRRLAVVHRQSTEEPAMKLLALMTTILAAAACHPGHPGPSLASPTTTPSVSVATTAELASRRAQLLAYLEEYTDANNYPVDATGMPISVFVDDYGHRCP